ncbi:MAG TPA: hypothetical protein VLA27_03725 [Paracoccaceae bacterium]|nr:hypothetical protein [Paracoccaceae bacterium]
MTFIKKLIATTALVVAGSTASAIELPSSSVFAGFVWTMGGGPGLTVKYVSSNALNTPVLAAGVSYYFDNGFGADLGLAYNTCTLSGTVGYDFLQNGFQFGVGALANPYCLPF